MIVVGGERVGSLGFRRVNERNRIAEAGRFAVHPSYRGRGIGDEAARLFQRHLLVDLDFHRIELQIYGFNERAIAQAERTGYVREGVKRKAYSGTASGRTRCCSGSFARISTLGRRLATMRA